MPEALTLDRNTSKKIGGWGLKALYIKRWMHMKGWPFIHFAANKKINSVPSMEKIHSGQLWKVTPVRVDS